MVDTRYVLVDAPGGTIELPRAPTRQSLRSEGYRYFEQDLDISNPREFFRKLRRSVQDHGFDVIDEQLNVQRGAVGEQVGEVVGGLTAVLTERVEAGVVSVSYPYRGAAIAGVIIGSSLGLLGASGGESSFLVLVLISIGIAAFLWRYKVSKSADLYIHTSLRMLIDGEVYAAVGDSTADSAGHGRRITTQMLSSKVTVVTSAEIRVGVDPSKAKPVLGSVWRDLFFSLLSDEGRKSMLASRDRVVAAAEEMNGRLSRLSEVA